MQDFNLDILKIGYFIVYKGNSKLFWRLVKVEQEKEGFSKEDSEYTHVEISGGGFWAISARWPRSSLINILKDHKGQYIKVVKYRSTNYDIKRYKVGWFGATRCNLPYSLLSVLWFKINDFIFKTRNIFATKKAPFCSFLCAWALKQVYKDCFSRPEEIMPAHFLNKDKFELVWEGYLPNL